jgi:hypothetical protein
LLLPFAVWNMCVRVLVLMLVLIVEYTTPIWNYYVRWVILFIFAVPKIKLRALCMLGNCSTTELLPVSLNFLKDHKTVFHSGCTSF